MWFKLLKKTKQSRVRESSLKKIGGDQQTLPYATGKDVKSRGFKHQRGINKRVTSAIKETHLHTVSSEDKHTTVFPFTGSGDQERRPDGPHPDSLHLHLLKTEGRAPI